MIRLPSGQATGSNTASGGTNTPTTNTVPSPVTPAAGNQSMQANSNMQSPTVGMQSFSGPSGTSGIVSLSSNSGSVPLVASGSSQTSQQLSGNSVSSSSNAGNKNGFSRRAPSPGQAQSNVAQPNTPGKPTIRHNVKFSR